MAHKHKQVNVRVPAKLIDEIKRLDLDDSTTKTVVAAIRFALANGWPPAKP